MKLKEICNISAGGTPSRNNCSYWDNGTIPWCKISDIKGKYVENIEEKITEQGLSNSSAKLFSKGTILYTIFATIGEVSILNSDATTNQAIAGIKITNNSVETEYLYYYLKSLKTKMINESRGVAQNNINLSILRELEITIPDKSIQKKIINELKRLERLIDLKKNQLKASNDLIKSQFVEMFGDLLSNDNKFEKFKLPDVASIGSSKRIYANEYVSSGIPFYRSKEIIELGQNKKPSVELFITKERYDEVKEKYGVPKIGDILITAVGTIGETWIVDNDKPFYYKDGNLLLISLKKKISEKFFKFSLDTLIDDFKKKNISGSSYGALTIEKFKNMDIVCPPIELQNKFANIVEQIDKQKFVNMKLCQIIGNLLILC